MCQTILLLLLSTAAAAAAAASGRLDARSAAANGGASSGATSQTGETRWMSPSGNPNGPASRRGETANLLTPSHLLC